MYKLIVVAAAFHGAGAAYAQTGVRPDPNDAKAGVPPVEYRSAFAEYQAHKEPEIANWRDVNEAVRSAGGHVGLAAKPSAAGKDARPKSSAPSEDAPRPPAGGHAGQH